MTFEVFFWYVFPLIVAGGAFGWIAYDASSAAKTTNCAPMNSFFDLAVCSLFATACRSLHLFAAVDNRTRCTSPVRRIR